LQDVLGIRISDALAKANEQLARHDYEGSIATLGLALSSVPVGHAELAPLIALRARAQMWAAWDRFDHDEALVIAQADPALKAEFARELKEIIRARALFVSNDPWPAKDVTGIGLVKDLLQNAARCEERTRFDDAAARLYRATELLAQVRLRRGFGLRTDAVDLSLPVLPEVSQQWLSSRRTDETDEVKIALVDAYRLLEELGDPLGAYYTKNKKTLLKVLRVRNQSLFAHGLTPINLAEWRGIGPAWRQWLEGAIRVVEA
jgi:CRISPR-associated protein (TIGR02710 family)